MEITFFSDLASLVKFFGEAMSSYSQEAKRERCLEVLREWGHTDDLANLFVSVALSRDSNSADGIELNGDRITGTWMRGEQTGNVGSYLKTVRDTWTFMDDLSYTHRIETNEDFMTTGPYFQSSYSGPKITEENGLWSPPDSVEGNLKIFILPYHGKAGTVNLEWVEPERFSYEACKLNRLRYAKEW